jgi:hypothetical protein
MSLNRTLKRVFAEVRREARCNPAFAQKLDAIIRAHASSLPAEDMELAEETLVAPAPPPLVPASPPVELNPLVVFKREGADGLRAALMDDSWPEIALQGLLTEHNLDPSGEAAALPKAALIDHIVAQAKRRAERDKKLFDY